MAASVTRLHTRADRLRADQRDQLRQMVLALPELPQPAVAAIVAEIDRQTASANRWTFVMIAPEQHAAVVRWIMANSSQKMKAALIWAECFVSMRLDTGEIAWTRDELAERAGIAPAEVSRVMGELETCGAIIRRREKVAGMRGRGRARYFMNPRVGTHLTGVARDTAQEAAPQLRLVDPTP